MPVSEEDPANTLRPSLRVTVVEFTRLEPSLARKPATVTDPKAYTKPFTVRIDQRIAPDQEMIEFICNENQQFRVRIKID